MTALSMLLLGLGLGLRHATDADHVVVISSLLEREPRRAEAARIAALWGLGHTAAFFAVGLVVVVLGLRLPPAFDRYAAGLVGAMLVGLGIVHLIRALVAKDKTDELPPSRPARARPVAIGLVHGLAGSAGIALLTATTIDSRLWATVYLALFGIGTVLGMVLLTMALAFPMAWTMRRGANATRLLRGAAALLSLGLGVFVLKDAFFA